MADALSVIPTAVLRNLSDKTVEGIVKNLTLAGEHEKITRLEKNSRLEFTAVECLEKSSHRGFGERVWVCEFTEGRVFRRAWEAIRGGLIGLAAVTVGLTSEASQHLEIVFGLICQQIVPPVLNSFSDQDGRFLYYSCEALYNIAKLLNEPYGRAFATRLLSGPEPSPPPPLHHDHRAPPL
ncbi:hypothetical protein ACFE04_018305 [Oxalis oulophora]